MKVLDLFSCVGCHATGMIAAGHEVVALCESNEWRQEILRNEFQGIPIYDDVKTIKAPRADVTFGGPPCQNTSVGAAVHGRRTGASLWSYMLEAGIAARSKWFVVEQPPGNKEWEGKVSADLCDAGFHVAIFEFGAHDVGAPYTRRRRYITACTSLSRLQVARAAIPSAIKESKRAAAARGYWHPTSIPAFGVDAWRAERPYERRQAIEALGDSNPPAMAQVIGIILAEAGV